MKYKLFSFLFLLSIILSTGTSYADDTVYLIDFVVMNEGHSLTDRDKYEKIVAPIAAKYGMQMQQSYNVSPMAGKFDQASRLNIWKISNKNAMKYLSQDTDYIELSEFRDEIHDMSALTLYSASSIINPGQSSALDIMVDLVVMNEPFGSKERDGYEAAVVPIASEHGMKITHRFDIQKFMTGKGPETAIRLNLWSISDSTAMRNLSQDPRYQELTTKRNELHDMNLVTLYKAAPIN